MAETLTKRGFLTAYRARMEEVRTSPDAIDGLIANAEECMFGKGPLPDYSFGGSGERVWKQHKMPGRITPAALRALPDGAEPGVVTVKRRDLVLTLQAALNGYHRDNRAAMQSGFGSEMGQTIAQTEALIAAIATAAMIKMED